MGMIPQKDDDFFMTDGYELIQRIRERIAALPAGYIWERILIRRTILPIGTWNNF